MTTTHQPVQQQHDDRADDRADDTAGLDGSILDVRTEQHVTEEA